MIIENGVLISISHDDIPEDGRFVVPDGVTSIGNHVFSVRSELTTVVIGDGVTSIGRLAFYSCSKLTSVVIGNGVTSIERGTFSCCTKLTSITIGNSVKSIGAHAFSGCSGLTSITIPDGVESIGPYAFLECSNLTTVVIGNGVVNIDMCAFHKTPLKSAHKNYKAFGLSPDGSLVCLNKTYRVGRRSFVKGMLTLCEHGIHYCTNLFEIFDYYYGTYGKNFVIAECEASKEQKKVQKSSKKCARWIIPQRILTREEIVQILNEGSTKK